MDAEVYKMIEELFREHYERLITYALGMSSGKTVAEDLVQETFFEAVRQAELLRRYSNPGRWLMKTLRFKLWNLNRKADRLAVVDLEERRAELLQMEEQYGMSEMEMMLGQILNRHERLLFDLYYIQGYSAAEMAKIEHTNENSIKIKIFRLRKKIMEQLGIV
ncbi:MAG: sigma-70 family RNA polymerase sigma factor [Clostridium sp.]|jgi:RNA polymerase sigma-70 factor (ECF subfamily)|nr:sigma-70 family RNA polymerase sigma factor [Clostridium sp.]